MKKVTHRYGMMIALIMLLFFSSGSALAETPEATAIVSPAPQTTVSSMMMVVGTANFKKFLRYEIFLSGGGNMIWAASGYSPVMNGNLARLDPRVFANGTYQLVIRQVRTDSNYTDYMGPTFTINNPLGSPLPYYPEIEPSFLYAVADKAVLRVRNCSGMDIDFDYNSPTPFHSSGDARVNAKKSDKSICTFMDAPLIPGEYRGTLSELGVSGIGYQFQAEAGKVYQLVYNGANAGAYRFILEETKADSRATADMVTTTAAATVAKPAENTAAATKTEAVLPQSGATTLSPATIALVALAFAIFIILGGFMALQRGRRLV